MINGNTFLLLPWQTQQQEQFYDNSHEAQKELQGRRA